MTAQTESVTGVEFDAVIARKETLAAGVVRLVLHPAESGRVPEWTPGSHLDLLLDNGLTRQYSLCGDPADASALHVAVLREPDGRGGSSYVHDQLTEGATIRVRGPRNNFALVDSPRYLFIAGGIGITPILPMLSAAEASGSGWRLVYGGRARESMAFRQELTERYGSRVTLCPQDEVGLLNLPDVLATADPKTAIYCCGPEPLLAAVEATAAHRHHNGVHVERFRPRPGAGERDSFEVELARSGTTLPVPADRSILEVVEEAGVQVLSSCREGTCGTCETPVLAGMPDHHDSLLTAEEQADGGTMMICVSRACGSRLVLDL